MNKYKNIITQKNNSLKQFLKLQKIVLTKKKVTKFAHTVKKACIHTIFILDVGILLYLVIAHTNVLTFIIFASATRTAPVILYKINHPAISCYFQIQQLKFHWYHCWHRSMVNDTRIFRLTWCFDKLLHFIFHIWWCVFEC